VEQVESSPRGRSLRWSVAAGRTWSTAAGGVPQGPQEGARGVKKCQGAAKGAKGAREPRGKYNASSARVALAAVAWEHRLGR